MKLQLNSISLLVATAALTIIVIMGIRERVVHIPQWFANPPASFQINKQQSAAAKRFWIPLQAVFLVSATFALVTCWNNPVLRSYLIWGASIYLLVIILTAVYFAREILSLASIPPGTPATPVILQRATIWLKTTTIRNVLQAVSLIFFALALFKSRV